jgi:heptosyltransferase-2
MGMQPLEAKRIVVLAPNWLGDAVMALPAITSVCRTASSHVSVAVRQSVSGLFELVHGLTEIVCLEGNWRRDAQLLKAGAYDVALLFPNSFRSAWVARWAGIDERWGYCGDGRSLLLSMAVERPSELLHQSDYYRHLTQELAFSAEATHPCIDIPVRFIKPVYDQLQEHGYDGVSPLIVLAPGAAYGTAKQWEPANVAKLIKKLIEKQDAVCVLVGTFNDDMTGTAVLRALEPELVTESHVINLIGVTTVPELAALLALSNAYIGNDSGASHLAAAVGTPVVTVFGPTNEHTSTPMTGKESGRVEVVTHQVWCRPCMLRECPIDHSCMTGVKPDSVYAATLRVMALKDRSRNTIT